MAIILFNDGLMPLFISHNLCCDTCFCFTHIIDCHWTKRTSCAGMLYKVMEIYRSNKSLKNEFSVQQGVGGWGVVEICSNSTSPVVNHSPGNGMITFDEGG